MPGPDRRALKDNLTVPQEPDFTVDFGRVADIGSGSGRMRSAAYDPQETLAGSKSRNAR
jgi:hypothetical protein